MVIGTIFARGMAALALAAASAPSSAQERTPPGPVIGEDGRVTFKLKAPDAQNVSVHGNWPGGTAGTTLPMARAADGIWTVTSQPIPADLWTYSYLVDGAKMSDRQNVHLDGEGSSTLLIPGATSANYEMHDVPHGTVSAVWYPAKSLGLPAKRAVVYTPPGYAGGEGRYPVLYLTCNYEDLWTDTARAANILDNLIAQGKARPMIVVMPSTVPDAAATPSLIDQMLPSTVGKPSRFSKDLNPHGLMLTLPPYFDGGTSIARDLVPFVDRNFRTLADRDDRAIVGLSASGAAAFYTAMTNVRIFGWTGGFSTGWPSLPGVWEDVPEPVDAAVRFPMRDPKSGQPDDRQNVNIAAMSKLLPDMNAKAGFHLIALYVGQNDPLIEAHWRVKKLLEERGVRFQSFEVPRQIHDWRFWMWCLNDYAPRLFKPVE